MSPASAASAFLDDLTRLRLQQWVLRSLLLLAPLLPLVAESAAGGSSSALYLTVVLLLAVLNAFVPDSSVGLFLVVVLAVHWTVSVPDQLSAWLLLAALGFVLLHVAGILAAYGPAAVVVPWPLVRVWLWRSGALASATVLVWFAARGTAVLQVPGSVLLFVAALVLLAGSAVVVGRLTGARGE